MSWANNKSWKGSDFAPMKSWARGAIGGAAAEDTGAPAAEMDEEDGGVGGAPLVDQDAAAAADALYGPLEVAASALSFAALCRCFEALPTLPAGKHRVGSLFPPSLRTMHPRPSLYPLLRLVVPEIDAGRGMFGMKHKSLATLYVPPTSYSLQLEFWHHNHLSSSARDCPPRPFSSFLPSCKGAISSSTLAFLAWRQPLSLAWRLFLAGTSSCWGCPRPRPTPSGCCTGATPPKAAAPLGWWGISRTCCTTC